MNRSFSTCAAILAATVGLLRSAIALGQSQPASQSSSTGVSSRTTGVPASNSSPQVPPGYVLVKAPKGVGEVAALTAYRVTIHSLDPQQRFEVLNATMLRRVSCVGGCTLTLPRGAYTARLVNAADGTTEDVEFEIERSCEIELTGKSETGQTAGLVVTIVGGVALLGGALLALKHTCIDACDQNRHSEELSVAGSVAMLAGAVAIPIGIVTMVSSRSQAHPVSSTPLNVAVASSGGATGLWLSGEF